MGHALGYLYNVSDFGQCWAPYSLLALCGPVFEFNQCVWYSGYGFPVYLGQAAWYNLLYLIFGSRPGLNQYVQLDSTPEHVVPHGVWVAWGLGISKKCLVYFIWSPGRYLSRKWSRHKPLTSTCFPV